MRKLLKNKVVLNFSYLTFGSIISQLLLLITVIKITKLLSPENYGLYSFILAQGLLLHSISDLGIKAIIIRTIARNPEKTKDLVYNGLKLRTVALILLMLIYIVYNYFLGNLEPTGIILLGLFTLVDSIFYMFEYVFLGNQKMLYPSLIKIFHSLIWFLFIIFLPAQYFEVFYLLTFFLALNLLKVIIFSYLLKKQDLLIGEVENFWVSTKSLMKEGWPYFGLMLLTLPTNHLSNNFLDINSTQVEVGYFNLAKKLMSPVTLIISFALTALFPNLAVLFQNNKDKFMSLISNGMGLFIGALSILGFIFTLLSKDLIDFFFSTEYQNSIEVVQLQVWYVIINAVNHLVTIIYGATNNEKHIFKLALISAIWSTPILFWGSFYGAFGISLGYVISFSLYEFYFWVRFKKIINIKIEKDLTGWISLVILFSTSYFLPQNLNLFVKFGVLSLGLIIWFLAFKKEIFLMLKIR